MLTRRGFCGVCAGGLLGTLLPRRARAAATRPHYVVSILLNGGLDPVLTVDPKDPRAVEGKIDCGYTADQRIAGKRRLYGPLFGDLLRHEDDLCLVHGVRVDTVSHDVGFLAVLYGKALVTTSKLFGSVLGAALPGTAPISHLRLDFPDYLDAGPEAVRLGAGPSAHALYQPAAARPAALRPPAWIDKVEKAREEDAKRFIADERVRDEYLRGLHNGTALRRLVAAVPPNPFDDSMLGQQLNMALCAIDNDVARFLALSVGKLRFDSHTDNLHIQQLRVPPVFAMIAKFIDELKRRRNAHGTLFEQTTLVMGSEIGRYPRLNGGGGKDHWPENTWILAGKGIRSAPGGVTVGGTNDKLQGLTVDFATGDTQTSANRQPIFIDAISATLLKAAGVDPSAHGFDRKTVLDCALRG